jgi:hypothetical protein
MCKQEKDSAEKENPDDALDRAIASIQAETVPEGPPPELVASTQRCMRYPFRSAQVKDICEHLTADESRRILAHARRFGLLFGLLISLILFPLGQYLTFHTPLYPPRSWTFVVQFLILAPLAFLLGWAFSRGYRKKQIQMLCDTDYAKRMGYTPDTLPLYLSFKQYKGLYYFAFFGLSTALLLLGGLFYTMGLAMPYPGDYASQNVLRQMANAYARCTSYRDTGVAATYYVGAEKEGSKLSTQTCFSTAFVRGDRLRFEHWEPDGRQRKGRFIVSVDRKNAKPWWKFWGERCDIQTWWAIKPGIEKPRSLDSALASCHLFGGVPKILMPEAVWFQDFAPGMIMDTKFLGDAQLDGVECYRVQGRYGDRVRVLWIDKKTYLLRRVDEEEHEVIMPQVGTFRVSETVRYKPVLNGEVPDEALEFDPPGGE